MKVNVSVESIDMVSEVVLLLTECTDDCETPRAVCMLLTCFRISIVTIGVVVFKNMIIISVVNDAVVVGGGGCGT